MPTRSFQDELARARTEHQWPRDPNAGATNGDVAAPRSDSRLVPANSFADELEAAHLAQERPLSQDQLERHRRR